MSHSLGWILVCSYIIRQYGQIRVSIFTFKYLPLFSFSFIFNLRSTDTTKSTIRRVLFFCNIFFFFLLIIIGQDLEICWHLRIPGNFMRLILLGGFWFVHLQFGYTVRFQFPAQFLGDHLPHSIVSRLILPLSSFATFSYYVINCFVLINR